MSTRPLLAGLAAGLFMTGAAVVAPAPALADGVSRLPYQAEVARIFPDVDGGTRDTSAGTALRGPDLSTQGDGVACNAEVVVVRSASGRNAVFGPGPEARPRDVRPVSQERVFTSARAARAAFDRLDSTLGRCLGRHSTRSETLTWARRPEAKFGDDRIGWSLRTTYAGGTAGPLAIHYVALVDATLVHVVATRDRTSPDVRLTQRLMWTTLRTLRGGA